MFHLMVSSLIMRPLPSNQKAISLDKLY